MSVDKLDNFVSKRPRSRWEDNIKMDLQEVGWGRIGTDGGRF
jgi:hypothetical protein